MTSDERKAVVNRALELAEAELVEMRKISPIGGANEHVCWIIYQELEKARKAHGTHIDNWLR
jgi:hypothetical protein